MLELLAAGMLAAPFPKVVYQGQLPSQQTHWRSAASIRLAPQMYQPTIPCSGVIVAPRLFLTAAHCLLPPEGGEPQVAEFFDASGRVIAFRQVTGRRLHPGYAPPAETDDLAILSLGADVPQGHRAAVLSGDPADLAVDDLVTVAGAGLTENQRYEGLRTGALKVTHLYPSYRMFGVENAEGRVSACSGDSGGAAYSAAGVVVGLVAIGGKRDCSAPSWVGLLSVAYYKAWIDGAVADFARDGRL